MLKNKTVLLLAVTLAFAVILCGAVAAEDPSSSGSDTGTTTDTGSTSDSGTISDSDTGTTPDADLGASTTTETSSSSSNDNSNEDAATDSNTDTTQQDQDSSPSTDNSQIQSTSTQEIADPIISGHVHHYGTTSTFPNVAITVYNMNDEEVASTTTNENGYYYVAFLNPDTTFKVTASSPGYTTTTQEITVTPNPNNPNDPNLYGTADFEVKIDPYAIANTITNDAINDTNLGLNNATNTLLITNAGTTSNYGQTTEDSLQAIVDATSTLPDPITYGKGNLLQINDPNSELYFIFITKAADGTLMAKQYTVNQLGVINSSETVYITSDMTTTQWNTAKHELGSNAFNTANIANLWAQGAPADLLATTYTTGNINQGTMDNYAMTKSFVQNYPSGSYYIITQGGGSDDDTAIYGGMGFNYSYYVTSSGDPTEQVFINYSTSNGARSGTLALMKENDLTSQFTAATGINVVSGTLSEIQFNTWLLNKLETDPAALYTVEALKSVNESNIAYLLYDSSLGYGNGIDKDYIANLNDATGGWTSPTSVVPETDYEAMKKLGEAAFNQALQSDVFTLEDLANGNVSVTLAPYYVNVNNKYSLVGFIDGIVSASNEALKDADYTQGFTIDNILTIRNPWTWSSSIPVIFTKVSTVESGSTRPIDDLVMNSVKVTYTYNSNTETFTINNTPTIKNISPLSISSNPNFFKDGFIIPAVAGVTYAWGANAPYSYLRTIGRVGCICSTKEYDIAMNLMEQYPLGPNEHYILLALTASGETGRQISGRTTAYGVSPGQGTYYSVGQTSNSAYPVVLIIWNDVTQTGRAMLIQYDSTAISDAMTAEGYTSYLQENDMFWHLDQVWNDGPDAAIVASTLSVVREIPITQEVLNAMTAAGVDPINYIMNYVIPTPTPTPQPEPGTSNGGTSTTPTTPTNPITTPQTEQETSNQETSTTTTQTTTTPTNPITTPQTEQETSTQTTTTTPSSVIANAPNAIAASIISAVNMLPAITSTTTQTEPGILEIPVPMLTLTGIVYLPLWAVILIIILGMILLYYLGRDYFIFQPGKTTSGK